MNRTNYYIDSTYYHLTIDNINENESILYLSDSNKNIIDFPDNTILCFYINEQKNILEKINQKYFIKNDIHYELQINNIKWSVKNEKKWDYELLLYKCFTPFFTMLDTFYFTQ